MGASSCQDLAFAKPAPRLKGKRRQKLDAEAQERTVYAAVDKRDKLRCVVTGRRGNPYALDPLDCLMHHHILQRGRDRGPTETWNICLVHRLTHDEIHSNNVTVEGDADEQLLIGIRVKSVEELFGRRRPPTVSSVNGVVHTIQVIAEADWRAWLDQHAARTTRQWIKKVGR